MSSSSSRLSGQLAMTVDHELQQFKVRVYSSNPVCIAVLGIRINRIHMFLGLPDPDPDPLVRGMDSYPDPSIIMQK
jgi:hypothetical protein